ncbi:hypothetical protein CENSYa_1454 [Cenarchaeum symbiosum A]|uniref:Uncharacterized protein n=1 Tax=Cenarchaeum symbiosum (strain A) TaxID=414004 RepID=A0RXK9_CENSY|nr:hypothetical protein CENSYa_1454 [Cenarchaeum symbiosum A]
MNGPNLSIFDTFKTKKGSLTGEAKRQRQIIAALAGQSNPAGRTRTAISQGIAGKRGKAWKNIYSGIFRDMDETLIPLGLVEEEGRLPLKRGPRALQEQGIPYYRLTSSGLLVSLSLGEIPGAEGNLKRFLAGDGCGAGVEKALGTVFEAAPGFAHHLLEGYVRSYCMGEREDLLPLDFEGLKAASDGQVRILKEFMAGYSGSNKTGRARLDGFLERIV